MTLPSLVTSFRIFFILSSNSPRYLVPATKLPKFKAITRFLSISCGTFLLTISVAIASATAVLPTPGSPTKTGLFLVRRDKIWITRLISWSRPITGSISPLRTRWFKLTATLSKLGVVLLRFFWPVVVLSSPSQLAESPKSWSWLKLSSTSCCRRGISTFKFFKIIADKTCSLAVIPSKTWLVLTSLTPSSLARLLA